MIHIYLVKGLLFEDIYQYNSLMIVLHGFDLSFFNLLDLRMLKKYLKTGWLACYFFLKPL